MKDKFKKTRRGVRAARNRTKAFVAGGGMNNARGIVAQAASHATTVNTFTKAVLSIVNKKEETKYVAKQLGGANVPSTLVVPANLVPAIPVLIQGIQSNQRIGQKITNVFCKVDFQFYLIPAAGAQYPTQDVWVKIFKLNSKEAKSYAQVASLTGGTLLDQGDQTTTDWSVPANAGSYQFMPLSKENFKGAVKTINLTKNQGQANADLNTTNQPNTYGKVASIYSYTFKHSSLVYDDTGTNYPTNFAPVFAICAMNTDQTPYQGLVDYQCRLHMWYKDS